MATDPNAMRHPLQKYWGAIVGAIVVFGFGGLLWWNASPPTPNPSVASAEPPIVSTDAGTQTTLRGVAPDKPTPPTPDMPQPVDTGTPDLQVMPVPSRRARVPVVARRRRTRRYYRMTIRSQPKAQCYIVRHTRRRRLRRFGSTPCRFRGRFGKTYTIQLKRPGYKPSMRIWTVENNELWVVALRPKKRPGANANGKKNPNEPGSVFKQTPNPFRKTPPTR